MSKWISVKDRLPNLNDGEFVLGYNGHFMERISTNRHAFNDLDSKDYYCSFAAFGGAPIGITHWMPLPEPPKD